MKRLLCLIVTGVLCVGSVWAQPVEEWVVRHNGDADGYDQAQAITLDDQGNIYVTGRSTYTSVSGQVRTGQLWAG